MWFVTCTCIIMNRVIVYYMQRPAAECFSITSQGFFQFSLIRGFLPVEVGNCWNSSVDELYTNVYQMMAIGYMIYGI